MAVRPPRGRTVPGRSGVRRRRPVLLDDDQPDVLVAQAAPAVTQAPGVVDAVAGGRRAELALDVYLDDPADDVDELLAVVPVVIVEFARCPVELHRQHRALAA